MNLRVQQVVQPPNSERPKLQRYDAAQFFFFTADHFLPSADDHSAHAATMTPLFARESDDIHLFFYSFLIFFTEFNCCDLNTKKHESSYDHDRNHIWLPEKNCLKRTSLRCHFTRTRAVTGQSHNTSTKLPHPRSPVFKLPKQHNVLR